jgi:hypothetical protein
LSTLDKLTTQTGRARDSQELAIAQPSCDVAQDGDAGVELTECYLLFEGFDQALQPYALGIPSVSRLKGNEIGSLLFAGKFRYG